MAERIPILVVDDDPDFLELVEYYLRLAGFRVSLADNGPEALEKAKKSPPAVILLDTTMPGMDGLEVLSELRHDPVTELIPVFMLTGRTKIGDIDQAFDIGASDYITKPVELAKLGAIVKAKLEKLKVSPKSK
ncbi:MAG: response regulator [Phycisphaerae bacterium]|nr:response regulator [Phycisphaerae bacterium]